jgi:hypothetical protein
MLSAAKDLVGHLLTKSILEEFKGTPVPLSASGLGLSKASSRDWDMLMDADLRMQNGRIII